MHRHEHRRLLYLVILALAIPIIIVIWFVQQTEHLFTYLSYPALLLSWAAWRIHRHPHTLPATERLTFWVIALLSLSGMAYRLHGTADFNEAWTDVALFSLPTLTLCVVLAHMIFGTQRALAVGLALVVGSLVLGSSRMLPDIFAGHGGDAALSFIWNQLMLAVLVGFLYVVGRVKDDYHRSQLEAERMRLMAFEDALTGLPNRRQLEEELMRQHLHAERHGRAFTVILCDLDRFKKLNDTYGHAVGDEVLQALGSLLQQLVRAGDKAERWGGEEFLIVAPDTDLRQGVALAERLRAGLEQHRFPHDIPVTASFGVATWAWGRTIGQLLQEADRHLYAAKDAGRNTVRAQPALTLGA